MPRVGEQRAAVCHCEYLSPLLAIFCRYGILILPPNGDQAARPVSSKSTNRMFGAPSGALGGRYGSQSGVESRTSNLMTPLNSLLIFSLLTWSGRGSRVGTRETEV